MQHGSKHRMAERAAPVHADTIRRGPVLPVAGHGLAALTALRLVGDEDLGPDAWQPAAGRDVSLVPRPPSGQDPRPPLAGRLCGLTALRELAVGVGDLDGETTSDLCALTQLTLLDVPLRAAAALQTAAALQASLGALVELHVRAPGGPEAEGQVLLPWF